MTLDDLRSRITDPATDPARAAAAAAAIERWAGRAMPPGALGRVEDLAVRVASITGRCPPTVPSTPVVLVFAGDHGVVADGASAWPSEVTQAMVRAMTAGGAAINAFAATVGAQVTIVDVGVAGDVTDLGAAVRHHKVRSGTASIARQAALDVEEARAAVEVGAAIAEEAIDAGADLLVGGDMGIGNTTPSTAIVARATGRPAIELVGRGAGLAEEGMARKAALVQAAVDRASAIDDPLAVLAEVGGLEIAALAGMHLAAAARRVPVVVDGVIGAAALCAAESLAPGTAAHAIAGHRSVEPASGAALDHLGLTPVLDLDLRLGEGTGACLAVPLVQAACRALRDMADLPG